MLRFGSYESYDNDRYGDDRHSALPWGYWLTSTSETPGRPPLVDEEGRHWPSVRHAFWEGRLGFENAYSAQAEMVLEFMTNYLAIVDGRFVDREERVLDIFHGERFLADFFAEFLIAAGLLRGRNEKLSVEGRAVLQMLISTRTQKNAEDQVGVEWIIANRAVAAKPEWKDTAERAERSEQVAARMLHRFVRDEIGKQPSVKLIGLYITKEIPVRSTLWTMSWPVGDTYARDRFYLWLMERIDRWDFWSEMVMKDGARALTAHFMKLAFCDRFSSGHSTTTEHTEY